MSGALTIEKINELIEQHSDEATTAIVQLGNYCVQDKTCRTPLNVAVQSRNLEVIRLLAESQKAINFSPSIDEELLAPVRHSVGAFFSGENVEETESYLLQSFGPHMCFQRTPLHTACRYADPDVIALLISKDANLDAKDIMGLTPLELCLQFGETSAIDRFISCRIEHKGKLGVTELALTQACSDAALYQQLIQLGKLDIKAKRFAFSLACALLDREGVDSLLEQGLDINKTMNDEFSPILEVCTSRSLSLYEHPEAPRLAGQYAAARGTGAIKVSNDDILNAESLGDIEALFSDAFGVVANKQVEQTSYTLSDEERQSQLSQRLALIDYLFDRGLDAGIAQKNAPYGFVGDIVSTNSPVLLQALASKGFSLGPEQGDEDVELHMALRNGQYAMVDPLLQLGHQWGTLKREQPDLVQEYSDWKNQNETDVVKLDLAEHGQVQADSPRLVKAIRESKWTWELVGESMLLAETDPQILKHNKPAIVRITHDNVYGPVDGVQLFVRIGDPDMPTAFEDLEGGGEWHAMALVEELLSIDGEEVDRSSVNEPVYGEAPWDGTYECELDFKRGKHSIEIKVVSDIESMTGVISGWTVTVTNSR